MQETINAEKQIMSHISGGVADGPRRPIVYFIYSVKFSELI